MPQRINFNELAYDDDYFIRQDDLFFTGTYFVHDERGNLIKEVDCVDGVENGIAKEWYPSGQLKSEMQLFNSSLHGESRQWMESGQLYIWQKAERGTILEYKEWNGNGNLVKHFELSEEDPMHAYLLAMRKEGPAPPVPPPFFD